MWIIHATAIVLILTFGIAGGSLLSAERISPMGDFFVSLTAIIILAGFVAAPTITIIAIIKHKQLSAKQIKETTSTPPPASWQVNPENPNQLRWWDGTHWADRYKELVQTPQKIVNESQKLLNTTTKAMSEFTHNVTQVAHGNKKLNQNLNFTAIDFETANSHKGSACAVGLAKVVKGKVVETKSFLINPPTGSSFHPKNIEIHGITPEMVENAPDWENVLSEILNFANGDAFVAHNAKFDAQVLREATIAAGVSTPKFDMFCTLELAREAIESSDYKLSTLAQKFDIPLNHHEAESDARACAQLLCEIAKDLEVTVEELFSSIVPPQAKSHYGEFTRAELKTFARNSLPQKDIPIADPDAPENLFKGHTVAITGNLGSKTRKELAKDLASLGATAAPSVTRKCTALLVLAIDREKYPVTSKERKAQELGIKIFEKTEFQNELQRLQFAIK